jgi:orotate phosphoribosyltransferase-like protein
VVNLFRLEETKLHSGRVSSYKIECDALVGLDIDCLAWMISRIVGKFRSVVGIPRGGLRIADALVRYSCEDSEIRLIVDDVLTTGGSMARLRDKLSSENRTPFYLYRGVVLFARGKCPDWVRAINQFPPELFDC